MSHRPPLLSCHTQCVATVAACMMETPSVASPTHQPASQPLPVPRADHGPPCTEVTMHPNHGMNAATWHDGCERLGSKQPGSISTTNTGTSRSWKFSLWPHEMISLTLPVLLVISNISNHCHGGRCGEHSVHWAARWQALPPPGSAPWCTPPPLILPPLSAVGAVEVRGRCRQLWLTLTRWWLQPNMSRRPATTDKQQVALHSPVHDHQ